MAMMMLHARVKPARRLKRTIAAISGVEKTGRMSIKEDSLYLEVMNPNHKVPVSVFLDSPWFDSYNFTSPFPTSNPNSTWTVILDLAVFNYYLTLANDDDQLEILLVSDSDFNRLYFVFDHPDEVGVRCHEMIFWRTVSVDMRRLREMEKAYSVAYTLVIPPHHFTPVLTRSMSSHLPMYVDITSSMTMLSSGDAMCFLGQEVQCEIENFPEDGLLSLQLSFDVADYFLGVARIAKSVAIKVPNDEALNIVRRLPPSICLSIDDFATVQFFFPYNSAVKPQLENWPSPNLVLEDHSFDPFI